MTACFLATPPIRVFVFPIRGARTVSPPFIRVFVSSIRGRSLYPHSWRLDGPSPLLTQLRKSAGLRLECPLPGDHHILSHAASRVAIDVEARFSSRLERISLQNRFPPRASARPKGHHPVAM